MDSLSGHEGRDTPDAPDLIEPLVAFRSWRAVGGRLRSPYLPVFWEERILHAECRAPVGALPEGTGAREPHLAPDPGCTCGIYAYLEPDRQFPTIDYRGVTGVVTVWGNIEVHAEGLRAQHARVEALAIYSRWSSRQKNAVWRIADDLGVDLVDLDEVESCVDLYGGRLPPALLPGKELAGLSAR
jgi:hypothetical protein